MWKHIMRGVDINAPGEVVLWRTATRARLPGRPGGEVTPSLLGDMDVPPFWPPFLPFWGLDSIFLGYFFSSQPFYKKWPHLYFECPPTIWYWNNCHFWSCLLFFKSPLVAVTETVYFTYPLLINKIWKGTICAVILQIGVSAALIVNGKPNESFAILY